MLGRDNEYWLPESISLVYVDFETQKCTIKDSGYRYQRVIESNG